jgi:hypothetical protein
MGGSAALLFGINYIRSASGRLNGCVNDVIGMADYLRKSVKITDIKCYDDETSYEGVTKDGMLRSLRQLAERSRVEKLDLAWIHYSGHGTHVADATGDELDRRDECLCPADYQSRGLISDDCLKEIFKTFDPCTRVICVFDCCHSGTIGDLKWRFVDGRKEMESQQPAVPARVLLLSGCADVQTSADAFNVDGGNRFTGALTSCLLLSLRAGAGARTDALALLEDVRVRLRERGFAQVPQLTASYDVSLERGFLPAKLKL